MAVPSLLKDGSKLVRTSMRLGTWALEIGPLANGTPSLAQECKRVTLSALRNATFAFVSIDQQM